MEDKWTQIRASCAASDLEVVSGIMSMVDAGLYIEDYSDIETGLNTVYGELIDSSILEADRTRAAVSVYLADAEKVAEALSFLRERFAATALPDVSVELVGIAEADWANEWKKFYHPVHISDRVTIVPLWEDYTARKGEVIVKMDSGQAFGSGTHETTRLCAEKLEAYLADGMRVLDVGTGSGILAILAAKLGASHIDGYDIDPIAVRVAAENAAENGVSNKITLGVSDLLSAVRGTYDVICANIVADIVIRMAPDVARHLAANGVLIASGIIESREAEVRAALAAGGLTVIETDYEKDWTVLVCKRA